ncbi:hypothetical protein FSP39_015459 [Pinctada imbricata]|uniref:Uncharacterized protein n=1 Tax=Pinctada imbricata TaxID=66713 RepID=A0AA88Y4T0_PINIB|nr:hypothetical protein FSP39_015459 [Pinctada imbricata]
MLRDKIVIGTKDSAVRACMLREPELTLDKAINMCRTSERTTSQLQKLQSGHQTTTLPENQVNYAHWKQKKKPTPYPKQKYKKDKQDKGSTPQNSTHVTKCKYCGGFHAKSRKKCPAYGQTCKKCNKPNHVPSVCRQQKVHALGDEDYDDDKCDDSYSETDSDFTYAITSRQGKQWFAKVNLTCQGQSQDVICQLDSGSTCNVISFIQYSRVVQHGDPPLRRTNSSLNLYGGKSTLKPRGKATI